MKTIFKYWRIVLVPGIILILFLATPVYVKYSVRGSIFQKSVNLPHKEFAIILGAGVKKNGKPGSFLKQRLDDSVDLYNKGIIKKVLVSGDNGEKSYDEISAMNQYLVNAGIPQNKIFGDYAGFDTYSTMSRARKVFGVKDAVIVTQKFHLNRSVYLAQQKGIKAVGYSSSSKGQRKYFAREWFATIKSFFDCVIARKPKFLGKKVNTSGLTNIKFNN